MKKISRILVGLIVLFIGSQILVSCSSESEVLSNFSKRKYTKSFKKSKLKDDDNIAKYKGNNESNSNSNEYASSNDKVITDEIIEEKNDNEQFVTEELSEKIELKEDNINKDYSEWNNYNRKFNIKDIKHVRKSLSNKKKGAKPDADTMFILMIILALFIPPLAVYLKDGDATSRFWLNLVLAILGIGLGMGFFYFAGLFYLAAMIHALLIVLDAI